MLNVAKTTMAAAIVMMGAVSPVAAGGFLADIIRPIAPKAADALDREHAKLGRPLDHAANAAAGAGANIIAPGSGPAVTGALEARDAARRAK